MAFQPHKFKAVTITTPAACKYCHEVISWGIPRPGFVCTGTNNGRRYGAHFSLARSLTEAVDHGSSFVPALYQYASIACTRSASRWLRRVALRLRHATCATLRSLMVRLVSSLALSLELTPLAKSGWLTKMGGGHKSWKKRWSVLSTDFVLYYFKSINVRRRRRRISRVTFAAADAARPHAGAVSLGHHSPVRLRHGRQVRQAQEERLLPQQLGTYRMAGSLAGSQG